MPIYDYACSNCSTRTEFIHAIHAPAPRFCPACGAEGTLRKVFVPPAVVFKGSGWAKKDRSGSSGSRTKAAASSASDGPTGSGDGGGPKRGEPSTDAGKAAPSSAPGEG